jgi:type IV secretory pathway TrbF-like protein
MSSSPALALTDSDPYLEARREWNDRYLDLAREHRLWQIIAGTELVALLISADGFRLVRAPS